MKKICLSIAILLLGHSSFGQYNIFMRMIENKILCNDDRFVNLLEHNGYTRINNSIFHYQYAENGEQQQVNIIYNNTCYALYSTTNADEYNYIKKKIAEICPKEMAQDGSIFYNCDVSRIHHLQMFFSGFFPNTGTYEIKIYQYPKWDE